MQLRHPDPSKAAPRVSQEKHDALRDAMLRALPAGPTGLTWDELLDGVAAALPLGLFAGRGSMGWHAKWVQLDLEARGLVERLPGSRPLRFRRAAFGA